MRKWGSDKVSCLSRSRSECPAGDLGPRLFHWRKVTLLGMETWRERGLALGAGSGYRTRNSGAWRWGSRVPGKREEGARVPRVGPGQAPCSSAQGHQLPRETWPNADQRWVCPPERALQPCSPDGGPRSLRQACQGECERGEGLGSPLSQLPLGDLRASGCSSVQCG